MGGGTILPYLELVIYLNAVKQGLRIKSHKTCLYGVSSFAQIRVLANMVVMGFVCFYF